MLRRLQGVSDMSRVWRRLSREEPIDYKIFGVRRERYESPRTGQALNATIVEAPDWVNVIALTPEKQCVLVRQYRFGTERVALEIPGGMIEPDESPLLAAERELREETGYDAQRWTCLSAASLRTLDSSGTISTPTLRKAVSARGLRHSTLARTSKSPCSR